MRRRKQEKQTITSLEQDIESKIRSLRTDYDVSNEKTLDVWKEEETICELLGPNLLGIHLFANSNLVQLLASHSLSESRGSMQSLLLNDFEDNWEISETWKQKQVWFRQSRVALEAADPSNRTVMVEGDASCLYHWSQALLCPDSLPSNANLVLFFPKRLGQISTFDEMFTTEFQALFEVCGFGLLQSKTVHNYFVHPTSHDETARSLGRSFEEWAKTIKEENQNGEDISGGGSSSLQPYVILIIWPIEAWKRTRSALAAIATSPSYDGTNCFFQLCSEELVLSNRKRKACLIGITSGLYSVLNKGIGAVTLASSTKNTAEPLLHRIHVAFTLSEDSRWLTFAHCTSQGRQLSIAAKPLVHLKQLNGLIMSHIQQIVSQLAMSNTSSTTAMEDIDNNSYRVAILLHKISSASFQYDPLENVSVLWYTDTENLSNWNCSSILDEEGENEALKHELDDLAFLSTISEYPMKGALRGVGLGGFIEAQAEESYALPIHLRSACFLARYLNGLVPDM